MSLHIFSPLPSLPESSDFEQIVLRRYPHAGSVYEAPIFHHGCSSPCCQGEWVILDQPGLIGEELGRGPTEEAAWKDAAKHIAPQRGEEAA